jgi:hypothetical protein
MRIFIVLYIVGMAVALLRTDASWAWRAVLAVLWPLGPLAFAATVTLLVGAAAIAFPLFGAAVAAAALAAWWIAG